MKYTEALALIGRVVKQESKLKGLVLDDADFADDEWLVLFTDIFRHIDKSKNT